MDYQQILSAIRTLPEKEQQQLICTDGHVSYKGFAMDNHLSQVVLRANLKEHVKRGVYHIQNVNSLHNQIKKWIDSTFWGVSTKYTCSYQVCKAKFD